MPSAVLFRVDADATIGVGHLQRCLSLASALARSGSACRIIVAGGAEAEIYAARHPFAVRVLQTAAWEDGDLQATIEEASMAHCAAVVVDSDAKHNAYLRALRDAGFFVCALDDGALHPFSCQLVVNGDAHAPRLRYRSISGDTRFLLGPRYSLLRDEFWDIPPRRWRRDVRHILVTLGGGDPHNLTPQLLDLLDDLPGEFDVAAVVGPFFSNQAEIEASAARSRRSVKVIHAPAAVRDLMLNADLAITAAGQTLYELACAGCPAVAVTIAANQEEQVRAFAEANIAVLAGTVHNPALLDVVGSTVTRLLIHPEVRRDMSDLGRRMVDGRGALRVARAILAGTSASLEEETEQA